MLSTIALPFNAVIDALGKNDASHSLGESSINEVRERCGLSSRHQMALVEQIDLGCRDQKDRFRVHTLEGHLDCLVHSLSQAIGTKLTNWQWLSRGCRSLTRTLRQTRNTTKAKDVVEEQSGQRVAHLCEVVHNGKNGLISICRQAFDKKHLKCGTRGVVAPGEAAGGELGLGSMFCLWVWQALTYFQVLHPRFSGAQDGSTTLNHLSTGDPPPSHSFWQE